MKTWILTLLIGAFGYLHAMSAPNPQTATRLEIAKYVIQVTYEATTYEEVAKKIKPYLSDKHKKNPMKAARRISKKMVRAMKDFEKSNAPKYRKYNGVKPPVKFRFGGGTGRYNSVTWKMYEKSPAGGQMTLGNKNGVWRIVSL